MRKSIKKALPHLCFATIMIAICAILEGGISLVIKDLIDVVLQKDKILFNKNLITFLWLSLAFLPLNLVAIYGRVLYKKVAVSSLKYNFMERLFHKNISEFQRDNNSKYVSAATNDMSFIEGYFIDGILDIIQLVIKFIVGVLIIASVSSWVLLAGFVIGIATFLLTKMLSKPLQKHAVRRSELSEGYTSYIKEVLSAFHIIRGNNLSDKVREDFNNRSRELQDRGYIISKIEAYITTGFEGISSISFMIIVAMGGVMALNGKITLGGLYLIIMNIDSVTGPMMSMGDILPRVFSAKAVFDKVDGILENEEAYKETLELKEFKEKIEFNNVSFSYDDTPVLNQLNLVLNRGEKYLVAGPSGGGKSTLLKLLRKYFSPQSGDILIDDKNLKDITKRSFFEKIANVEQDVFLFEDTLRNNLTLSKEYAEEKIDDVIDRAGLGNFIDGLKDGLDTMIIDNGRNISGGEKSRIAIARALLTGAEIIFMDEAFSSLDGKTAKEIERTILQLNDVTVINVSHVIFESNKRGYDGIFMVKNKDVVRI